MMARCGRPELDSCPRVVGCGASARKRGRLVLAPPKCARNPPPETTATQNPRANSRKPEQPAAWTAWKPSLQKAGTAKQPPSQQPGLPRSRVDGVEAVPPEGRNSRTAAEPTARTAWKPSLQKAGTAEERTAKQPRAQRARLQNSQTAAIAESRNSRQPTAWLATQPRGGAAGRVDGVEAVPPEGRNSQTAPGSTRPATEQPKAAVLGGYSTFL